MPKQEKKKVKVVIRVRPVLDRNEATCVSVDSNRVEIFNHRNITETIQYEFTDVFNETTSQEKVFNDSVRDMVPLTLQGHNVSVFAYGPTGAGKTHTMQGSTDNIGIIPRVVQELFNQVNHNNNHDTTNQNPTTTNTNSNQTSTMSTPINNGTSNTNDTSSNGNNTTLNNSRRNSATTNSRRNSTINNNPGNNTINKNEVTSHYNNSILDMSDSSHNTTGNTLNGTSSSAETSCTVNFSYLEIYNERADLVQYYPRGPCCGKKSWVFPPIGCQSLPESWCSVTFSYVEIYNEKVLDLLQSSTKAVDLPIREDSQKNIFVAGLTERKITNYDDFRQLFEPASSRRTTASTNLNDRSSRSHCIVLLKVEKTVKDGDTTRTTRGKFYLIDLAGSEDNKRTGNTGIRLKESGAINKSLFALGEVVDAINNHLSRIPYRNSKLTRLLQDSLGGNSHCVMITNIAPEERFYYDTYCTLNMASKSKKIVNNTTADQHIAQKRKMKPHVSTSHKQPRLTSFSEASSTENSPSTSINFMPATDYFADYVSRQTAIDISMNQRLRELERHVKREETCLTPRTRKIAEMEKQLEETKIQLAFLENKHKTPLKRKGLTDVSNTCTPVESPDLIPPTPLNHKPVKPTRVQLIQDVENVSKETKFYIDKDAQQKYNVEVLSIVNTGTVKKLKCLQTIGDKRAQLIYNWRETHGPFDQIEDLIKVEGFTKAMLQRFLKKDNEKKPVARWSI